MNVIPFAATITKVETMAKGCLKMRIDTQELDLSTRAELLGWGEKFGYVAFMETPSLEIDLSKVPPPTHETEGKSPSKRLRAVLYIYWEQRGSKGSFETFYANQMEVIIDALKDKLT